MHVALKYSIYLGFEWSYAAIMLQGECAWALRYDVRVFRWSWGLQLLLLIDLGKTGLAERIRRSFSSLGFKQRPLAFLPALRDFLSSSLHAAHQKPKLEALYEMATSGSNKTDKEKEKNMGVDYVICFRFASTGECFIYSEKRCFDTSGATAYRAQTKLKLLRSLRS